MVNNIKSSNNQSLDEDNNKKKLNIIKLKQKLVQKNKIIEKKDSKTKHNNPMKRTFTWLKIKNI